MTARSGRIGRRRSGSSSATVSTNSTAFAQSCAPPNDPTAFAPIVIAIVLPFSAFVINVIINSDVLLPEYLYFGMMCGGFLIGNHIRKKARPAYEAALEEYDREWVCKTCARRFVPIPEFLRK